MREALERDGFAAAERVLDDDQVAGAREAAAALLATHAAASDYGVIALDAWRRSQVFHALLAPLASVACELVAADAVLAFQDLVIDKPPAGEVELPWHQDASYLPLDRDDGVVAWVALDDADAAHGCLRYVPGSHLLGVRRAASFGGANGGEDGALQTIDPEGRPVVLAEAAAGDAWFHTLRTWHASAPNRTTEPRRAWSVWFIRDGTRWAPERAAHPYLLELDPVSGSPVGGERFPRFERA